MSCAPGAGAPFGPDIADDGLSPFVRVEPWGVRREGRLDEGSDGGCACDAVRIGVERFVERLRMSFPCTARLSVDFFKSRVSIWSMFGHQSQQMVLRLGWCVNVLWPTISIGCQLNNVADTNIDHPKESLILLLELPLVEHLHGENAVFIDLAAESLAATLLNRWYHIQIEAFIPIGVEILLRHRSGSSLLAIYGGHREWVRFFCEAGG